MTLLEAMIAFVILSVVGVVCLDQARGATQLQTASAEWTQAVARGESALSEAVAGTSPYVDASVRTAPDPRVRVERRSWRAGVDQVEVTVLLANGAKYTTARLTPTATGRR